MDNKTFVCSILCYKKLYYIASLCASHSFLSEWGRKQFTAALGHYIPYFLSRLFGERATYNYGHLWMVHWFRTSSVKSVSVMTAVCTVRTDELYSQKENGSAWLCLRKASPHNALITWSVAKYRCRLCTDEASGLSASPNTTAAEWHQICCKIRYGFYVLHVPSVSGQYRPEEYIKFGIILWILILPVLRRNLLHGAINMESSGHWPVSNLVKTAHFQRNGFPFSSGNFGVVEDICQSFIRKPLILKAIFFSYSWRHILNFQRKFLRLFQSWTLYWGNDLPSFTKLATVRKKVLHTCIVHYYNPSTPLYSYLIYNLIRLLIVTVVPE